MPLDLGGGGFNSIRWMASKRAWVSGDEDVALEKAVFDLENIKSGWVLLAKDTPPEVVWDENGTRNRPDGAGEWKRGFEVEVWAPKLFGGDDEPRPFMTNATGACMGIQALYVEFEAQRGDNAGKVPLVACLLPICLRSIQIQVAALLTSLSQQVFQVWPTLFQAWLGVHDDL